VTPVRPVESATGGSPSLSQDRFTTGIPAHERPSPFETFGQAQPRPPSGPTTSQDTFVEVVRPPEGNSTQGNSTQGNTTQGNSTQGNTTQGNTPQGNTTQGSTTQGNATQGNATQANATEADSGQKPGGKKPGGKKPGGKKPTGTKPGPPTPANGPAGDTEIIANRVPPDRARTVLEPTRTMPAVKAGAPGTVTPTTPTVITPAVRPDEVTKTQPITRAAPVRAAPFVAGATLTGAGVSVVNDIRRIANGEAVAPKELAANAGKAAAGAGGVAFAGSQLAKATGATLGKATGVAGVVASTGVSAYENVQRARAGEISNTQATANVVVDTGVAVVAVGSGTFVSAVLTGGAFGTSFGPGVGTLVGMAAGTVFYLGTQTETGRAVVDKLKEAGNELLEDTIEAAGPRAATP
jgi:hypothetical protein